MGVVIDTEAVGPVCMTHRAVCARRGCGVTHRQHGGFGDVVEKKLAVLNEQRCIGYRREIDRLNWQPKEKLTAFASSRPHRLIIQSTM